MVLELRFPEVHSLKEKRRVLARLSTAIRATADVVTAETAHQDTWQRSALAVAFVSSSHEVVDSMVANVVECADNQLDIELLSSAISYLEPPEA
ncbi:MAG: DUF503 domain-containing protein [Acidimicrobiia bacterium]|nr:DUF503 domain-containing protein [Acidimicrobiia bacterium]MDH5504331.1 DUF503 domain-containing protein [Acidimicrobiia bacterium]